MSDDPAPQETFEAFKNSFSYSTRTNLDAKFLAALDESDAAAFFEELIKRAVTIADGSDERAREMASFLEGWQTVGVDPEWARLKAAREQAVRQHERVFAGQLAQRSEEARQLLSEYADFRADHERYGRKVDAQVASLENAVGTTNALVERQQRSLLTRLLEYPAGFQNAAARPAGVAPELVPIGVTRALSEMRSRTEARLASADAARLSREQLDALLAGAERDVRAAIEAFAGLKDRVTAQERSR